MQPDTRQRFQGKCYRSSEGWQWMNTSYDTLPPIVRARLQSSDMNICAACVWEEAREIDSKIEHYSIDLNPIPFLAVIDKIENAIRAELANDPNQPIR